MCAMTLGATLVRNYVAKYVNNYLNFLASGYQDVQTLILRKETWKNNVLRNLSAPKREERS